MDNHTSYHKDGSVWTTRNGKTSKVAQHQPFNSFKGKQLLSRMIFTTEMSRSPATPPYKMKELDAAVHIERPYEATGADIGVNLTLLEPKRYSLLEGIEFFTMEIHLYPSSNPWLVISIFPSDPQLRQRGINAVSSKTKGTSEKHPSDHRD